MHIYHKQAEEKVKTVISDLEKLLPRDGEDISYYTHGIMDEPIKDLIEIKILMARANEAEERGSY